METPEVQNIDISVVFSGKALAQVFVTSFAAVATFYVGIGVARVALKRYEESQE